MRNVKQFLFFIATGGALAAGTLLGWTSPTERLVVPQPNVTNWQSEYSFDIDDEAWSWVGSTSTLGAAAMVAVTGPLLDLIGRKTTMLLMVLPFLLGWGLIIWCQNLTMLLVGRVILGIAGGAFCIAAPIYTAEIAQNDIRGSLGSYFQLMLTVGILFVYAVGAGVSVFILGIICGVIPIIYGAIFVFMPESPLYYVSKNRTDDAVKSLKWLRGEQYDYSAELAELQRDAEERSAIKSSWLSPFKSWATARAFITSMGLMLFQQMSGINAVIFYTVFIFDAANTGIDGSVATIIVGVMQVIATFVASLVVDKIGRRIMLLASISMMAVCTILLGVYFFMQKQDAQSVDSLGWLPIVSMCVFIIMFSIGFGPIPWLMIGELFSPDVKGPAGSFCGFFNWILAFIITKTFTNMRDSMGIGPTFWLFSGFSIAGTLFVAFFVIETKGKSLIEIQEILGGKKRSDGNNGTDDSVKAAYNTSSDEKF